VAAGIEGMQLVLYPSGFTGVRKNYCSVYVTRPANASFNHFYAWLRAGKQRWEVVPSNEHPELYGRLNFARFEHCVDQESDSLLLVLEVQEAPQEILEVGSLQDEWRSPVQPRGGSPNRTTRGPRRVRVGTTTGAGHGSSSHKVTPGHSRDRCSSQNSMRNQPCSANGAGGDTAYGSNASTSRRSPTSPSPVPMSPSPIPPSPSPIPPALPVAVGGHGRSTPSPVQSARGDSNGGRMTPTSAGATPSAVPRQHTTTPQADRGGTYTETAYHGGNRPVSRAGMTTLEEQEPPAPMFPPLPAAAGRPAACAGGQAADSNNRPGSRAGMQSLDERQPAVNTVLESEDDRRSATTNGRTGDGSSTRDAGSTMPSEADVRRYASH